MNLRQDKFIDEYLLDFNAARAAVSAGYGTKNAKSQGWRLLADPEIQAELARRKKALTDELKITQEQVLQELATLDFSNLFDFIEIRDGKEIRFKDDIPLTGQKAVVSAKIGKAGIEVKLYDKIRALELLGKYTGLFDSQSNQSDKENNLFEALSHIVESMNVEDIPELNGQQDGSGQALDGSESAFEA